MKIKANGITMNYEVKGRGENLVLIHGAGDNLNMWYDQIPILSREYRTIIYDVRGSGETESPEMEYSISLFAEDLHSLMEAIKVKEALFLGFSMGGHIALELAIRRPNLAKAIILANSPPVLTPPLEVQNSIQIDLDLLKMGDIRKFAERMALGAFSPDFKSRNPSAFIKYMKVKLQNKPDGIRRQLRTLIVQAPPLDLSEIKCPVLFIVGENDPFVSLEQVRQAHQVIADSELAIMPTGHASAIEMPDNFNSLVLQFLSRIE